MEPTKLKNRLGFTIIEMLLVAVLVALLATVAAGTYARTHQKALVKKSACDFLLAAKYAKILAIEYQSDCKLEIDATNNGFTLVINERDKKTGEKKRLIVRDLYFKPVKFTEKIKFEDIRIKPSGLDLDERNVITFSPNGTAQEAVVQIGDGENYYTVCISAVTGKAMGYAETAKNVKSNTIDLDQE